MAAYLDLADYLLRRHLEVAFGRGDGGDDRGGRRRHHPGARARGLAAVDASLSSEARAPLTSLLVLRPEVELAAKLVERYAAGKVSAEVQDQVRLEVETAGNAITIWECRPPWRPGYGPDWTRMGVARFRYSPSDRSWTVYWMRSDLKFHRYTLVRPQAGIGPLLDEVARDPHACFWG